MSEIVHAMLDKTCIQNLSMIHVFSEFHEKLCELRHQKKN